jgi:hypothetical protein
MSCRPAMLCMVSSVALCCWSHLAPLQRRCTVAAYPHVLQVLTALPVRTSCRPMMALTPVTLGTCAHALGTGEPSCVGRSARLFFMLESHDPQGAVGHALAALEPS